MTDWGIPHRRDTSLNLIDDDARPIENVGFHSTHNPYYRFLTETTFSLDTSSKKIACIHRVPQTTAAVGYYYCSRTGAYSTSGLSYRLSMQTVTPAATTGSFPQPSGTDYPGMQERISTLFNAENPQVVSFAITAPFTVTEGDYVAIVMEYYTGTVSGSNYRKVGLEGYPVATAINGFPIGMTNTGSGWVRASNQYPMLGFATRLDSVIEAPIRTISSTINLSSTTTPFKGALSFQPPINATLCGAHVNLKFAAQTTAFDLVLYRATHERVNTIETVELRRHSYVAGDVSTDWSNYRMIFLPVTETKIRNRDRYLLSIEPSTSSTVSANWVDHDYVTLANSFFGSGHGCQYWTYAGLTHWTQSGLGGPAYGASSFGVIPVLKNVTLRRNW